jgi:hypothetical protein
MRRRTLLILVLMAGAALGAAVITYHLATRPRIIASYASPDGRWRLVVRDVDPNPYQLTTTYTIEDATSHRAVPGRPFISKDDSAEPNLSKPPTWASGSVRINGLVGRFDVNGQTWSRQ